MYQLLVFTLYFQRTFQNNNDRSNATLWQFSVKHLSDRVKIIQIATFLAAYTLNKGFSTPFKLMEMICVIVGRQPLKLANYNDKTRVQ